MKAFIIALALSLSGCASYTSIKDGSLETVNAACFMVACQVDGKVIVGKGAE